MTGNGENVAEYTPLDIDSLVLVDVDIVTLYLSAAWGSDALVCLAHGALQNDID